MTEKLTNATIITEFLLMGFTDDQVLQGLYVPFFFLIYLTALMGNLLIIILTTTDQGILAAYSEEEHRLVIVAVNVEETAVEAGFSLAGFRFDGGTAQVIRTSADENWAQLPEISVQSDMLRCDLAPYSITTFLIDNIVLP